MTFEPGLISVVMPVYNGETYLTTAIESLLAQEYALWELVVIDDGSIDGTARIVQGYTDPRLRYHYQTNRGQAAALNTGLSLARGEFVTTLDADDWYPADSLQARVALLVARPECGACYGDGSYCYADGRPFLKFTEQMPAGVDGDVYDTLVVSPFYGTGAAVLIRRAALAAHDITYDEAIVWCQDWDFYIRLAAHAHFAFTPTNTIFYRMHEAGMTRAMPQGRRLESLIRVRHKVLASPRFAQTPEEQRSAFFYDFLIQDLQGRVADQAAVFAGRPFQSLSRAEQSRLMRIAATRYLLQGVHLDVARRWLRQAWRQAPTDKKTAVVALLATVNGRLARKVVATWQNQRQDDTQASPFDLALTDLKE
jgi:glycosyltransferase involved in cell wall biosynthesis